MPAKPLVSDEDEAATEYAKPIVDKDVSLVWLVSKSFADEGGLSAAPATALVTVEVEAAVVLEDVLVADVAVLAALVRAMVSDEEGNRGVPVS